MSARGESSDVHPISSWRLGHPRQLATVVMVSAGTFCALIATFDATALTDQPPSLTIWAFFEAFALVATLLSTASFGPWVQDRDRVTLQRAVATGVALVILAMFVVFAVSSVYVTVVSPIAALPVHFRFADAARAIFDAGGLTVLASVCDRFVPEIVGAWAGFAIWWLSGASLK